jgi:hypothetical protein
MKKKNLTCSIAIIAIIGIFTGCSGSGSSSGESITNTENFKLSEFIGSAQAILEANPSTANQSVSSMDNSSAANADCASDNSDYKVFCDLWDRRISTTNNSDSLLGFLKDSILDILLPVLEANGWDFSTQGITNDLSITVESETFTFSIYTEQLEAAAGGYASKVYLDVTEDPNYEDNDYTDGIEPNNTVAPGQYAVVLKKSGKKREIYWLGMDIYNDDFDADKLPTGRTNKQISGGRVLIIVTDPDTNTLSFEHLTSTERHNRQEHYIIKLDNLKYDKNTDGSIMYGSVGVTAASNIYFLKAERAYFKTTIDGTEYDLVNDNADGDIEWSSVRGKIATGMQFISKGGNGNAISSTCIKIDDLASPETVATGSGCANDLIFPTLTNNFATYTTNNSPLTVFYVPPTGAATLADLDLRVNMFALYDNYAASWLADLEVTQ